MNIPSKTFLLGEYLAVLGGPALIATTEPGFRYEFDTELFEGSVSSKEAFHPESPAGRLSLELPDFYVKMTKPYEQEGGFGGSTADFLAVHRWCQAEADLWSIREKYLTLSSSSEGLPPSGADLVAQATEGCVHISSRQRVHGAWTTWPFEGVDVLLLKTQQKVATHEHLKTLAPERIPGKELQRIYAQALKAWLKKDGLSFAHQLQAYGDLLNQKELLCEPSQQLLEKISAVEGVIAGKGCGALGADTLAFCVKSSMRENVLSELEQHSEVVITLSSQLSPGDLA